MTDAGTLDILGEIEALVQDKLQVVSYKWLSRKFSVSSNDAKRMLQEFVGQKGSGLEIVYTLSGWLKNSSPAYHIRLVSGVKLAEVKKEYEDNCSIQVYSVQACIPKDPAALWNAEFVQAEELFDQPSTVDNCLRDNRFCGVLNSFVQRNTNGSYVGIASIQLKNAVLAVPSKSSNAVQTPIVPQPQQGKVQLSSPKIGQSSSVVIPVKSESIGSDLKAHTIKAPKTVEKVAVIPANKKKVQNEKGSSKGGGSLANLWGRASVKAESVPPPSETNKVISKPFVSAEAQICALESVDTVSSDDDVQHVKHRRASNGEGNRKRRVVFESSDEEDDSENAVNLASPEPPKKLSSQESEHKSKIIEKNLNFESHKGDQPKIKEEKAAERESILPTKEDVALPSKSKSTGVSLPVKPHTPETSNVKDKPLEPTPSSSKRRRVLKTRIDERGREVTEVVWEGEETESKNTDKKSASTDTANNMLPVTKKSPLLGTSNSVGTVTKKSPSLGSNGSSNPVGKNGAKKAAKGVTTKDAKQGNIMSFFKKV